MKNIVLMCAGGMSTSIIMKNIKKAADAEGLECEVSAHAVSEAASCLGRRLAMPRTRFLPHAPRYRSA